MEMDKPLEKIVAGRWDLKTAAEEFRKQRPPTREELDELARLAKNYKAAKQEDDPEKMITAIDALLGHKADLAEKLGPVKIQLLMKLNRQERALEFARTLERGPLGEEPGGLNTIAWGIVDPDSDTRPKGELLQFALAIARKADEKTEHRNAEIADTLGIAYFESGDVAESPRRAATGDRSPRTKRRTRGLGDAISSGKVPEGSEPELVPGPRKMDRQRGPAPTTSPPDPLQKGTIPRPDAARDSGYPW